MESLIHESLPNAIIHSIERVQNLLLYRNYIQERHQVCGLREIQDVNHPPEYFEQELFHGSRNTPTSLIVSSTEGFDPRFSSSNNLWGRGMYFSETASYSVPYAYKNNLGYSELIVAKVLVGREFDYGELCNQQLIHPPQIVDMDNLHPGSSHYDSVCGETKNTRVHVVYSSSKSYPTYLVNFTLADGLEFSFGSTSQIIFQN